MEKIIGNSFLDKYFDETTMSLHIKENSKLIRKKWEPGNRKPVVDDQVMNKQELKDFIDRIYKEVENRDDGFLEIDRSLSKVIQLWPYRIVIVYPPLSDWLEMTIVKPIKKLSIEDYNLDKEVFDLLRNKAKWILISGSPWSGKTTFAQALIDVYHQDHNIIKTIESPRDLLVDDDIVQYSFTYWSHDEVRDILLLSRPDYTVYDEVRNKSDFELYKDLRLTWIWLVWVIHATRPVDSIQRFLWTIEMWVIPQVIDTVIYIEKWNIKEIYQLQLTVKVPEWMESEDLARPVIIITSFISKKVEYEVYTFWEQIVVMPINDENFQNTKDAKAKKNVIWEYAKDNIKQRLKQLLPCDFFIKVKWSSIDLYIPEELKWRIIWKWWMAITSLEKTIWLKVNVKTFDELPLLDVKVNMNNAKKSWHFEISLPEELANKNICLLIWTEIVYFNSDPIWVITIQDRAMVKTIQKRWFVIVDTENI